MSDIAWVPVVRERAQSLLFVSLITYPTNAPFFERLGLRTRLRDYRYLNGTVFMSERDLTELEAAFRSVLRDPQFLAYFRDCCRADCAAALKYATELGRRRWESEGAAAVATGLVEYFARLRVLMPYLFGVHTVETFLESRIRDRLLRVVSNPQEAETLLIRLAIPLVDEDITLELRAIFEIARAIAKRTGSVRELVESDAYIREAVTEHLQRFGWMGQYCFLGDPMSLDSVIDRLSLILRKNPKRQLDQMAHAKAKREEEFEALIKQLDLEDSRDTLMRAREYIAIRMERINVYFKAHFQVMGMLCRAASLISVPYEGTLYMTDEEFLDSLGGARTVMDRARLTERALGYGFVMIDGERTIISGDRLAHLPEFTETGAGGRVSLLKGAIACEGEVVGQAKIIKRPSDIVKMNEGDVLVSPMTTPDLMPAIQRAVAIVTDEGGILCHAAIVSRELNIPCVIGTDCASRVIRDGDTVKVSATGTHEGTVEIGKDRIYDRAGF